MVMSIQAEVFPKFLIAAHKSTRLILWSPLRSQFGFHLGLLGLEFKALVIIHRSARFTFPSKLTSPRIMSVWYMCVGTDPEPA